MKRGPHTVFQKRVKVSEAVARDLRHGGVDFRRKRTWLVIAVIVFVSVWPTGTFDNFLWRVHLNYNECATNGFGATFCGDALKEYEKRFQINP